MTEEPETPRRLHPATLAIRFLERLPQFVLGLPAIAYFSTDLDFGMLLLIALAGLVISMLSAWIWWRRFSYETADGQLVIESGVFSRNRRTIPFDRIQDVSLEQSLLARIFGVSIVRIETGSAASNEGKLDCVSRHEADRLRDLIRAHRHAAAPVAPDEQDEARPPL
ncbi:MAG: PH domain-containing protein, partial [Parasphingopyxis sp.]